ncbi:OmpA family protein [Pararhodobacter zhoushanensis]|uniref:OmpA family protein n=1 Tax=Pararhodobacter zhoushanensis TaxID=2479545 RepID=UPI000F8C7678|nr:OmpA family protein [Pararhodobacter zhoushanensis]
MKHLTQAPLSLSRRSLLLALGGTALTACSSGSLTSEVGSNVDEGAFGNPTAHNLLIMTGQLDYAVDLAERFEREVPSTVNFAFDSARLDGEAQVILRRQAAWIRQFPEVRFRVFGNTDLVGSEAYNRGLGLRRARAVVAFLIRNGVSRSRVEAVVSNGETQPLIPTQNRERQNRRAVTQVSGFVQDHPLILNGEYALIVHREYVQSATRDPAIP